MSARLNGQSGKQPWEEESPEWEAALTLPASRCPARSSEMHEATRRLLGVLLRQLDGYGPRGRSIVVGATNRRQDLDPALLSRFDAHVSFGLPSADSRCGVRSLQVKKVPLSLSAGRL